MLLTARQDRHTYRHDTE